MRHYRFVILFLFTLATSPKVKAQENLKYFFKHITQSEGLLHNGVYSIAQDAKGFIWIASFNGLQRYDGSRFLYYADMLSNSFDEPTYGAEIFIDKKKKLLWVMKNSKMEKMELGKNNFTIYNWEDILKDAEYNSTSYRDNKNVQWFLNDHLIYYVDNNTRKKVFNQLNISQSQYHNATSISSDTFNNVKWAVVQNNLYLFDKKRDSVYSKDFNPYGHALLQSSFFPQVKSQLRFVWVDSGQNIWVTTWGDFFYRYDHLTKKIQRFSLSEIKSREKVDKDSPGSVLVSCMMEDDNHSIWIGTENAGLLRYNAEAQNFDYCIANEKDKNSIQYNYAINSLFQDKERNIWIGTDKGINVFSPYAQYFKTIHYEAGALSIKKDEITSVIQTPDGNIFIGTWGGGVSIYDSAFHFKKNIVFKGPSEKNFIWSIIQADRKTIWFGCQHGYLILYNLITGASVTLRPGEMNCSTIICMEKDNRDNIWMGLHNGNIVKWDRQQNKFFSGNDSLQTLAHVNNILIDKDDNIWASTTSGFKKFDERKMKFTNTWIHDKNNPKSFSGFSTKGIAEYDDSTLIIGTTYGGLNFFNKRTESFSHLTTSDGLPFNNVYAIKKDTSGFIWLTSDYALCKFIPGSGKFIPYELPGVINSFFVSSKFYTLKDGEWLAFTFRDVISFSPYKIENKAVPTIEITGFTLFNTPLNIDSVLSESKPLQLAYTENFFTIEFASLSFSNLHQINYYYRLSGVDKNWVNGGTKRFATYTSLQPGKYIFEIKGDNGNSSGKITSFEIIITPPFWQTWWFITLISLLVFLIVYTLIKWRIKSFREIDAQKLKVEQLNADHYKSEFELEQIINYFSSSLIKENTINDVLSDVAKNLNERLGFVDSKIYLWNNDKTKMIQRAGFDAKNFDGIIDNYSACIKPGQGVVGFVIQSNEPVLIADTTIDSRYRHNDIFNHSEICVPVIYNSELIGIINSEHPEKNFFTRRHLQILNTIATLMATKIKSIEAEQSLLHTQIKMYGINEQLSNARLEALRSQMNPHFIFNCLNSIDALIHSNDKYNATTYLNKFAKLLRNILDSSRQNAVTLSKDAETLKLYIELEVLRHENKFKVIFNIDEKLLSSDYKVPPLIVQPFVENAILHGLKNKEGNSGILTVNIIQANDKIQYTITDNGIGRKAAKRITQNKESHYGLQITNERIRLFNKEAKASVHIDDLYNNEIPEGTSVTIILNVA